MSRTSNEPARFALTLAAAGERGQTAAVSALLEKHGAYVEEFAVSDDVLSGRFHLRAAFRLVNATDAAIRVLHREYAELRSRFRASEGGIRDLKRPMRVLLMVSRIPGFRRAA